jgi:superfamily II DNA or RNA helicase
MSTAYADLLARKRLAAPVYGRTIDKGDIHPLLFPFQRDITAWAIRKGRAAIFADTGLGKTFMQLEWARLIGERTLIVAPLSVARQTQREAEKIGVEVTYSRDGRPAGALTVTNYEMVEHFDPADYGAVVLDESSILKALDGRCSRRRRTGWPAPPRPPRTTSPRSAITPSSSV